MLFSEIYGNYFNAVAEILSEAVKGTFTDEKIWEIVQKKAFGESILTIPNSILEGKWPLIDSKGITPLHNNPKMPLTIIQKRWMKSLLLDPRIALFNPSIKGLEDIEPLFTQNDVVYYDQYLDGDRYEDLVYQENFRIVLTAIKNRQKLEIKTIIGKGNDMTIICVPHRLEYSLKDDKFRMIGVTKEHAITINIARIVSCHFAGVADILEYPDREYKKEKLELLLIDDRNALERCMLHFSDFEKRTEKMDDKRYHFFIEYYKEDETELLIRILSFGPKLKVISPDDFKEKIKERLLKQKSCGQ